MPDGPALVLGGTGFIGAPLVRAFSVASVEAIAACRSGGADALKLDRRDPAAVRRAVRELRPAVVVDLLAYTGVDTLPLLDALSGEVARYVMASSADVYRNYEGLHRRASPPPLDAPQVEDGPLRSTRFPYRADPPRGADAPDAWLDAYDKIPLEQAALACAGFEATVGRLPMVYGPGDRQRRFRWIAGPMLAGVAEMRVDPEWRAWRATYGFVEDVASALAAAALHLAAAGQVFNAGEPSSPMQDAWIARFAQALGWRGEVVERPARGGPLTELDLRYPLATDTGAIRQALGWAEPTPPAEAIARTAADERTRG